MSLVQLDQLDTYIHENFDIVGTVQQAKEAEIILFGEMHLNENHRRIQGTVINTLHEAYADDVLLVEELSDKDAQSSPQRKFVNKSIETRGWDNRYMLCILTWPMVLGSLYFLFSLALDKGSSLSTIVCKGALAVGPLMILRKLVASTFTSSNQNMCRTIEAQRNVGRKIYVVAGQDHLRSPPNADIMYQQGVQCLQTYLQDKKHLILIPKAAHGGRISLF